MLCDGRPELTSCQPPLSAADAAFIDDLAQNRCRTLLSIDDTYIAILDAIKEMGELEKTCALTDTFRFILMMTCRVWAVLSFCFVAADVLVTSDHGFNLGHHMLVQAKMLFCAPPNPTLLVRAMSCLV